MFWFIIYELVCISVSIIVGLELILIHSATRVESIVFIRSRSVLEALIHIWLNNTSSFLLASALIILHPLIGVFLVAFMSISTGELISSWLAGYCSSVHLLYGLVETQAYIILWLVSVKIYYVQHRCGSLTCRWYSTINLVKKQLLLAFTVFLILAVIEVLEVNWFG